MAPTIRLDERYSTHQKYSVDLLGEGFIVTVTPTCSVIRNWISDVVHVHNSLFSRPLVVGVGIQWTPAPRESNSQSSDNSVDSSSASCDNSDYVADTLQLCVGRKCLIIQLRYCEQVPNNLRTFLRNPRNNFVGVWNYQDAKRLAECRHELEIEDLVDIKDHVYDSEGNSMKQCSFEKIVEKCMGYEGVRLVKRISMSDWAVPYLHDDQILQASVKAYVCHKLGVRTRIWLL